MLMVRGAAVHRELGYQSHMTIEKGLQEMREAHDQRDRAL